MLNLTSCIILIAVFTMCIPHFGKDIELHTVINGAYRMVNKGFLYESRNNGVALLNQRGTRLICKPCQSRTPTCADRRKLEHFRGRLLLACNQ